VHSPVELSVPAKLTLTAARQKCVLGTTVGGSPVSGAGAVLHATGKHALKSRHGP
jgi:hypothetical protein